MEPGTFWSLVARSAIWAIVFQYFQNLMTQHFFNFRLKLTTVAIARSRSGWSRSTRGRGCWSSESWENPGSPRFKLKLSTGFRYVKVLNSQESISLNLATFHYLVSLLLSVVTTQIVSRLLDFFFLYCLVKWVLSPIYPWLGNNPDPLCTLPCVFSSCKGLLSYQVVSLDLGKRKSVPHSSTHHTLNYILSTSTTFSSN